MMHFLPLVLRRLARARDAALLALLACCLAGPAQAQDATFKNEELDQMLAPIALYPDSLLAQVLMASTYPADIKDAAAWTKAHPDAKGDDAIKQVESQPWDPSVKSLAAFPQVLTMMGSKPSDVQRLGDAFLADPAGLFNASLDGNMRRAIDIHEGETIDEAAFQALIRAAIARNQAKAKKPRKPSAG